MIISRTPFRVSFFGGGTDFAEYYEEHGGATLLSTINKYCYISVHELSPLYRHNLKVAYSRTENVEQIRDIQHPLVREALLSLDFAKGVEISHVADVPGRTGLGSSSSFTVGLLHALHAFRNERVTAEDLAREAIHIERVRVGDAGGHQDQYAAAYGGVIRLDFGPGKKVVVRCLPLPAHRIQLLEAGLLMFYLGFEKTMEASLKEQTQGMNQNARVLAAMKAMVDEGERILSGSESLDKFGELLDSAWQSKRKLSSGISNPQIDEAYARARAAGAIGGKLLGAGGRGFLLLYARPDKHEAIRREFGHLNEMDFKLNSEGSRIIFAEL